MNSTVLTILPAPFIIYAGTSDNIKKKKLPKKVLKNCEASEEAFSKQ